MQFAVPRRGLPSAVALLKFARAAGSGLKDVTLRIVGMREGPAGALAAPFFFLKREIAQEITTNNR